MKIIPILTLSLLGSIPGISQVENAQMGAEFKEVATNAGRQIQGIQTYGSGTVKGCQFFYPTWTTGSITTKNNQVISNNYTFLYDKVRQDLFIKWKDSAVILLADKDQIKSFSLLTDREHNFVPAADYDPSDTKDFYEVLEQNDQGYTLLKLIQSKFVKADYSDMMKVRDGDVTDEFDDNITYLISYKKEQPQIITLKQKSLEKAFPAVKQKIANYLNQTKRSDFNENYLIGLIQSLNN